MLYSYNWIHELCVCYRLSPGRRSLGLITITCNSASLFFLFTLQLHYTPIYINWTTCFFCLKDIFCAGFAGRLLYELRYVFQVQSEGTNSRTLCHHRMVYSVVFLWIEDPVQPEGGGQLGPPLNVAFDGAWSTQ